MSTPETAERGPNEARSYRWAKAAWAWGMGHGARGTGHGGAGGSAACGRVRQKEPQRPTPASECQPREQTPLSGLLGKVGIASGDFHRILEIPLTASEDSFIQGRQ